MSISAKMVKELREKTGVGMMDCKKALVKTEGDIDAAIKFLREKGLSKAAAKADRATSEGLVHSYIHTNGKLGVLVEVKCETDFVARTDDFVALCKDIAMHIAASNPMSVSADDIDPKLIEAEREIYRNKALNDGKPEKIVDKIVDGQIKKFLKESCLLEQEFVKDPDKTVLDLLNEAIARLGENIQVSRFTRFALGEK
ncbi:MAG: translation elongation factor Ts [Candidatus Cloacimonetes bacterium]|nr:translation elongation factor Ts [Candidatus Cloacimonadota bacterium]